MIHNKYLLELKILTILVLFLTVGIGCSNLPKKRLEQFSEATRVYNSAFERKSETGGATFVKKEMRADYLMDYLNLIEKISFFGSQPLDQTYLLDGEIVDINENKPNRKKDFNQVVITLRYRYVLLPDNRLRTKVHKQHWYYNGKKWEIEPNLTPFITEPEQGS